MELLFVAGFFVMLLLTGVSVIGVLVALLVGTLVMLLSGFLLIALKLLPWLLLAVAVAWVWQTFGRSRPVQTGNRRFDKTMSKINRINRRW
ncbi:envelope stress response protein PspG [Tatumella morbirosei]|uniref:envelope stress response protein PspG n=1 Tax=Tatumella morbirosei TaxID=642227 RepID=UPI00050F185C|nr:envelope stress response protein PspG [Tatumella morbirosei]